MCDEDTILDSREPFEFATARRLVHDLFEHRPWIYWSDFLGTLALGAVAFGLCRRLNDVLLFFAATELPDWLSLTIRSVCFVAAAVLYFRAVNFIHEVVHLPAQRFWLFGIVWNLLCGVPFLTPSFAHETHLDHHSRRVFGTTADGEYLALGRLSRWWIAFYLSQAFWGPPLAVVRFGLLTPLSWFSPRIRKWIHRRFSSLVMDPRYQRPLPSPQKLRSIRFYEALCLAWIVGVGVVGWHIGMERFVPLLLQAYFTGVAIIGMNCLRTMGAHRFHGSGAESTLGEQLLDSVNIDSRWPWDLLLAPVGLRFHATHHLFPGIPYHNLPTAHRRLMHGLPANSLYHRTREPSLFVAIAKLWRRERSAPARVTSELNSEAEPAVRLRGTRTSRPRPASAT